MHDLYIAPTRLYLDADGRVVAADDPGRRSLLAPAGGVIPMERARALGLVVEPAAPEPAPVVERAEPVTPPSARRGGR